METTNRLLDIEEWCDTLSKILQYYADIPYCYGDVKTFMIISQDRNHFMLLHEGWENRRHVYGTIVHAEICHEKIWIYYDGIEDGITDELVAAGVPKDRIVLAFHPPDVRQYTGYGVG
ncbi:XisI protein [Okeania sp.]|uniref:XisI protein n=1 Tax=Okeania sp. TaxID=3100323 RepID=UPI002B4B43C9|nr:XisI protein [Okeania sp.]MEB3343597.1 XisI protein [Okeania sp.]